LARRALRSLVSLAAIAVLTFGGFRAFPVNDHNTRLRVLAARFDYCERVGILRGRLGFDSRHAHFQSLFFRAHRNPDRPAVSLSKLPTPAYDLVDFDAFGTRSGDGTLPYAPTLSSITVRFNAYDGRRVAEDVAELTRVFRMHKIALVDSNFLVNTRGATDVARGLIASRTRVGLFRHPPTYCAV